MKLICRIGYIRLYLHSISKGQLSARFELPDSIMVVQLFLVQFV